MNFNANCTWRGVSRLEDMVEGWAKLISQSGKEKFVRFQDVEQFRAGTGDASIRQF